MSNFYYDNPLAAAWMGDAHGMNFYILEPGGTKRRMGAEYAANPSNFYRGGMPVRAWVEGDSVHLLEPREGDFWRDRAVGGEVVSASEAIVTVRVPTRENGKAHYCCARSTGAILLRDGKAFHAPERLP